MRVLIAGAGIIGVLTAWELRRRGVAVTLIDPTPAQGATRAAAGMLAPVSEVQYGQEALYPLMLASAAQYPRLVAELTQATPEPLGYRQTQTIVVGVDQSDREALANLHQVQLRFGMDIDEISVAAARRLESALAPRLAGAFLIPGDHQVDPRQLASAALDAVCRPGTADGPPAQLIGQRVRRLLIEGAPPRVTGAVTDDGTRWSADVVVLASGVDATRVEGLPPHLRVPLRPVYGDIVRLRTPARLLLPGENTLFTSTLRAQVHGQPVYLVPRDDGGIVIGATSREDDLDAPSTGGTFRLLRDASAVVPAILETELVEVMARARPGTPDDLPVIGTDPELPGVVLSSGYFRHGVLLAPLGARLTADLVTGSPARDATEASYRAATAPERFSASAQPAATKPTTKPPTKPKEPR
ncbi:MAG: glycine oxidase ThiO [Austwickia sp.]|nr:glycine oxidase ThiO [Austwickia sp.]